jgi:photosystem II stability/assembly factor-like uncharacterized protein
MRRVIRWLVSVALCGVVASCATPPPAANVSATPGPSANPTPSASRSVPPADVVWALVAGTRLFRSTDRGGTWQERSAAFDPIGPNREIAFISDTEGWIATPSAPGTQCTFQSVAIAHTSDAGGTWDQRVTPGPPPSPDASGLGGAQCKQGLAFADAQHGFLSAWDPNSAPTIYRTADGGRTWVPSTGLPDPPGFTSVPSGVVLRADRPRAFGAPVLVRARTSDLRANYVFRSVDGGATWTFLAMLPVNEGGFAFVTATQWLLIAPSGSSMETSDGGASWHPFTTDYSQAAAITPVIVFGDGRIGYATVRGSIQRTLDGGAHWTGVKTPGA